MLGVELAEIVMVGQSAFGTNGGMAPTLELLESDPVPTGLALSAESNRAFARWTARPASAYCPRLGAEGTD